MSPRPRRRRPVTPWLPGAWSKTRSGVGPGVPWTHPIDRRRLLTYSGRGAVGFALLTVAACSADDPPGTDPTPSAGSGASPSAAASPDAAATLSWSRVDLGFVSAYVLVRGGEAAVVDTGVEGSAEAIGTVLDEAGVGWSGVRHVVLTHKHPDHAGSIGEVLERATGATGYVGAADLTEVDAPLTSLADGADVFGLQIVATPGHTAGHLAVFDAGTGVLVAGDALNNDGGLTGPNPQYTDDPEAGAASVRTMAALRPETILVGHGDPVVENASDSLLALADSLA